MTNYLPIYMLISLFCTIAIETFFGFLLGIRKKRDFLNIILVNILTNPLLVSLTFSINIVYGLKTYYKFLIILEILVVLIEGLVYKKNLEYRKINVFVFSLILNCCSYFIGTLINNFLW